MARFFISIFLLVLCAPKLGPAQTPGVLAEGQRVRVAYRCKVARDQVVDCRKSRSPRVDTGHLQAIDGDTLHLRAQSRDGELAIPRASIAQLWVVDGRKGNLWAGAQIGLVAGALIGGVVGATQEFCLIGGCAPATFFGVIIGAPVGVLLGGIVGSQIQSDRWRSFPLNRIGTSVGLRLDAVGLRVSVAF